MKEMTTTPAEAPAEAPNEENAPNAEQQEQEAAPAELTVEELTAKYEELKKNANKWETRSKENFDKAKAWEEYQDSQKPLEQKNAERLAALEAENQELRLSAVKATIGAKYGFNEAALKRLHGSTADELEEDAKELHKLFGSSTPTKPDVKPVATQGNVPGSSPTGGKAKTKAEWLALRAAGN